MNIGILGIRGIPASYGGFETCAEHVSRYWAEEGNDVLVYCREGHYRDKLPSYNRCRLKYISSIKSKSLDTLSHTFLCVLDVIFKERAVKHVHLYNGGNGIFIPLLKLGGKKVIISVDGIEWKREKWGALGRLFHKLGERFAVWFADEVIADNKVVEDYYYEKYGIRVRNIPYGAKIIEPFKTCEDYRILESYKLTAKEYFIFVGRLVPEKGVHTLVETYGKMHTSIPLIIVGDDSESSPYRNGLLKQGNEKIRFLGYVYGKEYECLLKNALMYVSASQLEGTSPSLLAAMGAGVCALVNGIPENLSAVGDSALSFEENDPQSLLGIWQRALKTPGLIEDMGKKGRNMVVGKYRWQNIAGKYLEVFRNIHNQQQRKADLMRAYEKKSM